MSSDSHFSADPLLPHRFTASNAAASDATSDIDITVVRALPAVSVAYLDSEVFASRKTVYISSSSRELIGSETPAFLVKTQPQQTEGVRHGVLIKCGFLDGIYELLDGCISPLALDAAEEIVYSGTSEESSFATATEFLDSWNVEESELVTQDVGRASFSMKPPAVPQLQADVASVPKHYMISPQNEKDPLDFILSRYYNTLYSLTTPLSYFPKTALSRFKNMCKHDAKQMLECLSQVYLTPNRLDERRSQRYGLVKKGTAADVPVQYSRFEVQNQELFIGKNFPDNIKEDLLESLVLDLKIREAQLQILILLEILVCLEIEEEKFLDTNPKPESKESRKSKKPRLIRGKRKTVIPTFLGMGVAEVEAPAVLPASPSIEAGLSPSTLYTSLTTLIDQIGLWDSLSGRVKSDKDQNTHGFLAFVIIPYFSKTLPAIVQFMVKNFKGLRPNLSRPKKLKRDKNKATRSASNAEEIETVDQDLGAQLSPPVSDFTRSLSSLDDPSLMQTKPAERKSKFTKTLMTSEKFPLLNRAATSIDDESKPAFSLKRSKSSLGTKNLKRRQVDISVVKPDPAESEAQKSASFLFMDARKIKSTSSISLSENIPSVVRQVEATPAKPAPSSGRNSSFMDAPQVFATPSNRRTMDMGFVVEETPQITQGKKTSVRDRISQIARTVPANSSLASITSSPVQESDSGRMFSYGRLGSVHSSSPVKAAISSPVAVKTKPGQMVSLSHSPFYSGQLDGSPPFKVPENGASPFATKKVVSEKAATPAKSVKTVKTARPAKPAKSVELENSVKPVEPATPLKPAKPVRKTVPKKAELSTRVNRTTRAADVKEKSVEVIGEVALETEREVEKHTSLDSPESTGIVNSEAKESVGSEGAGLAKPADAFTAHSDGSGSDSDSDSDYERLLAAVQRPAPKKYVKKRNY